MLPGVRTDFQKEIVDLAYPHHWGEALLVVRMGHGTVSPCSEVPLLPLASLPRRRWQCFTFSHCHDSEVWRERPPPPLPRSLRWIRSSLDKCHWAATPSKCRRCQRTARTGEKYNGKVPGNAAHGGWVTLRDQDPPWPCVTLQGCKVRESGFRWPMPAPLTLLPTEGWLGSGDGGAGGREGAGVKLDIHSEYTTV